MASSKVLIVTGASRGIGAAIARQAGREGYAVAVNYVRDREAALKVCEDIRAWGSRALPVQADVSREAEVVRLFETADAELGPLSALVNNAATTGRRCLIEDVDEETLHRVLALNVAGYFLCAREALKRLSTQRGGQGGVVVNVSSVAALLGNAFDWVHYGASKGAIDTFTRGLALEGAPHGVRCNAVRPGMVRTEINPEDRIASIAPTIPLGRVAEAPEIAEAVLWLLSDKASYCTGTIMNVSGGR